MEQGRTYGPFRQADAEPASRREYRNGVVRTVVVEADGRRTIAWDYTNDIYKA